jgi:uncharacterized protein YggT (Ycf19 family)
MDHLLEYWYFHLPNYLIAALIYTMLGRFVLGLFVPPESANYIWRFFVGVTDPVLRIVEKITPAFVLDSLLPLIGVFWLFVVRLLFWFVLFQAGLAPRVTLPQP